VTSTGGLHEARLDQSLINAALYLVVVAGLGHVLAAAAAGRRETEAALRQSRAGLEARVAERTQQLDAVRAVSAEITRELDLARLLTLIVARAQALLQAERCMIRLWSEGEQVLDRAVSSGLPLADPGPLRLDEGVSGVVARRRAGCIVNDYAAFAQAIQEPQSPTPPCASLGAPLLYHDRLIGVIVASHHTPGRPFTEADLDLLHLFAEQAAIAIENARAYEAAQGALAERTRAEEALRRYQLLAEQAQDIVLFVHRDGRILEANRAAAAAYGYTLEELGALRIQDLRAPETQPLTAAQLAAADAAGLLFETVHRRKDGTPFPVEVSSRGMQLHGERILGSIVRDISARTAAEVARQQSERRLATLLANLPGIAYRCRNDEAWTMEFLSEGCEALTGYPAAALLHNATRRYSDLILPEDREPAWDAVQAALAARRPYQVTYRLQTAQGEVKWAWEQGRGVFGEGGTVRALEGFVADITDRKQAEEALAARTQQLDAVRTTTAELTRELDLDTLLALLIRRAITLLAGASGTVYLWEETAQHLVPRAWDGLDDWIGALRIGIGEGIVGEVAARREGTIVNDFRTSGRPVPAFLERTQITATLVEPLLYRSQLLGVITVNFEDAGRVATPEDAHLLRLLADQAAIAIANARLFTDAQHAYEDLRQAQDEMVRVEKLRALGQLAAGVAHDLNNMLTAILGQTQLLRLQVADPRVQGALHILETAATDGAQVVSRLQGFARQQPTGPLAPCDLAALLQEAVELTRPRWKDEPERQGRTVAVRLALEPLPAILGTPPEIREALTNLILNAVDAMPHGGTLTLAAAPTADSVRLTLTDTGIGMTETVRQRVFEPFFSTKGGRGTGLGLALVYGILERHGGSIAVDSAPRQGTTFTLRFQRAQDTEAARPAQRVAPPCPQRILLIDDDPAVRQTVAALLRAVGHRVTEAEGGEAGLAHLAGGEVDLVLTDLGMPGMTGWDVARAVKARAPQVPIILLTGWGERQAAEIGERAFVDRILGKPVQLHDLLVAMAEVTGGPDGPAATADPGA
jgi:PAS domain S-box-containing protein